MKHNYERHVVTMKRKKKCKLYLRWQSRIEMTVWALNWGLGHFTECNVCFAKLQ